VIVVVSFSFVFLYGWGKKPYSSYLCKRVILKSCF
jgi:hypothetical protein